MCVKLAASFSSKGRWRWAFSAECFGGEPEIPVDGIFFLEIRSRVGKFRRFLMETLGRLRVSVQDEEGWEKQLQEVLSVRLALCFH